MVEQGVVVIFIDGLGMGTPDSHRNPLAQPGLEVLQPAGGLAGCLPREGVCLPTDALMGVPGLPQSATNQTSLYTGLNAARQIGHHLSGFPTGKLKGLIVEFSIFRRLVNRGLRVAFANTYTPGYLANPRRRKSVTTVMAESAAVPLRRLDDLQADRSLYMDFTNRMLQEQGFDVVTRTAAEAAEVLVQISKGFHFTLYEYFLTDLVGHRGSMQEARLLLRELDVFLGQVVAKLDLERHSLIITSDHGNIEDMGHGKHTKNPVPTLVWGSIRQKFAEPGKPFELTRVAPLIEQFFS